jgi:hypothetical protein
MEDIQKQVRRQRLASSQDKEARLEREAVARTLDNHWVDIKGMNLNPPISDFHCKFILQKFTG